MLEEVANIRTGIAISKRSLKDPVSLPYLRVANVQDGFFDLREMKSMQIERKQIERYSLAVGDVLMTEGGDADKLGRGDVWQGQIQPCLHQNHVFAVRAKQEVLLPSFLNALTASQYGRSFFLRCAKKSTNLASINSSQLKQFPVLLPPLAIQQRFTQILSSWEMAIAASDELIRNSEMQKDSWLKHFFSNAQTNPQWRRARLAELVTIDPHSLDRNTPADYRFRYIQLANVTRGVIDSQLQEYRFDQAPSRARRLIAAGNILLSMVRPNLQGFARASSLHAGCVASTGFAVLAVKTGTDASLHADYLYHYLFSPAMSAQIQRAVSGTNYPQMNTTDVAQLEICFPPMAQQHCISKMLDQLDQRLGMERQARQLLLGQKMALVELFLSGELDLRYSPSELGSERCNSILKASSN